MTQELSANAELAPQESNPPLLRVFLFGAFRLEWLVPSDGQQNAWNQRTSARSLFKLLLCAPDRQATRSQLTHLLWPDVDEQHARTSLRSAVKILRQVLRTDDEGDLLETEGDWLRLPPQSRLWVDCAAFEALVEQAQSTINTDDAVRTLWIAAHELVRGEFLADEPARDWTTAPWIRLRRDSLLASRRRAIHQCADALLSQGQIVQAETILQTHISQFPTDQDALVRLISVLIEQGRSEEARQVAARSTRALAKVGKHPPSQLRLLLDQASSLPTGSTLLSVSSPASVVQFEQVRPAVVSELSLMEQTVFLPTPHEMADLGENTLWFDLKQRTICALVAKWSSMKSPP